MHLILPGMMSKFRRNMAFLFICNKIRFSLPWVLFMTDIVMNGIGRAMLIEV